MLCLRLIRQVYESLSPLQRQEEEQLRQLSKLFQKVTLVPVVPHLAVFPFDYHEILEYAHPCNISISSTGDYGSLWGDLETTDIGI